MQQEKNILVNRGIPRTPSSSSGFGFSARGVSGPDHADRAYDAVDYAFDWLDESNESVEECFKENIKNITYITDAELVKTRATVRAAIPTTASDFDIELRTLNLQLSKARADHQQQIKTANLYYGHDPLTHKARDPAHKGFELVGRRGGQRGYYNAIAKWNISYAAAYQAKFLAEQIKLLETRLAIQNKTIAEAKAKSAAAAQAKAQAEAKRAAEERARLAAEAKRLAEEQARLAAEAQRLAAAAKAAAQAEAKRLAAEEARKATEAEIRRTAEVQALRQALSGRTFPMLGAAAGAGPVFATAGSTLATSPATTLAIQAALRTAVTMAVESLTAVAAPTLAGFAALLYSPKLANGELPERYTFSTPLSELAPTQHHDLHAIAAAGGTVDLPVRLTSQAAADGQSEILVINTDGVTHPSKVRVLPVTYNAQQNLYTATTEETPPRTLTWTPVVQPGNSFTALPAEPPAPPAYTGASVTPVVGRIDPFPEITQNSFNDYVFVFPIDSGLPPLYVMFRNRREDPGIAAGTGAPVLGVWTDAASKGKGAPIPSQIADQLRGKEFGNFKEFREALWKAVADDPILSQQFNLRNRVRMKKGRSAYVRKAEKIGGRTKYELHHKHFISLNGQVYDIDNITLTTPKRHIEIHRERKQ
ncbi:S-type pyocin domain-containing protein [Pseudomonas viciae]|uniref:S-type pyocin domain-containing protein n=1 Tax=Pseudomonas viciae TaxID=2505979 RepID=UPI002234D9CC|nr:S-type pyocin domain-containing protein [Pseudomonas viciae]UZE87386.1 S-type pyocin domain-containing protein [Pseudomonas viciae]